MVVTLRPFTTKIPIDDGGRGFLRVHERRRSLGIDLYPTGANLTATAQQACAQLLARYARSDRAAIGVGPTWLYVERVEPDDREDCLVALLLIVLDDLDLTAAA